MQGPRLKIAAFALAAVTAMAAPAIAQDYTTSTPTSQYASPPTSATTLTFGNPDDGATSVNLPFSFPYFGSSYSTASVGTNGYIQLGGGSTTTLSNPTLPASGANDGCLAVMWMDLDSRTNGSIQTWTTGTAPNRKFIVSWEGVTRFAGTITMTIQLQLHETSGRIIMAYGPQTTWDATGYTIGIDAIAPDNRHVYAPGKTGANNSGKPPTDYQFDPTITTFTGTVLIDEVVSDASGFGNSVNADVAPTGLAVELRSNGAPTGFGVVDASGDYTIRGVALVSADVGEVALVSSGAACLVSSSTDAQNIGPPESVTIAQNVNFGTGGPLGTARITDANDGDYSSRGPIQIALQMAKIHTWVTARTVDPVPQVHVFYSNGSSTGTRYSAGNETTAAFVRIGGSASGNQDAFDTGVVTRAYARHVLRSINSLTTGAYTEDVDATTTPDAAFIDGFGHYLFAMTNGATQTFDGTSSSATTVFDMETPDLSSSPGPDVAGWVAAALFDLVDADNEGHDLVDGTSATNDERPFDIVDALTEPASATLFLDEWVNQGHDAPTLVTNFVHHGLLPDDAAEPNDSAATAFSIGQAGVRSSGNTLNRYNEDWYEVLVPAATDAFIVEMAYNRFTITAQITLEIRSTTGSVLATGAPDGTNGPIRAITGALGPGPVHIRIAHDGGETVTDYTIQAYSRIAVSTSGVPEWTVRRTINQDLQVTGGIPPYTLSIKSGELPRGMILDEANGRLIGSPLDVGTFNFTIGAADSGEPVHNGSTTQVFKINEQLSFSAPELTGVAISRATSVNLGRVGGTDPITVTELVGTLPNGLSISEDFEISGTATEPGGGLISFDAIDVAGSPASMSTTLVVCSPIDSKNEQLPFAAGDAASGFYFDALAGGSINLKIKTAKKRAKRLYDVLVLGPDGQIVAGGVRKASKAGKITLKKVPTPKSGRYFVAFSSATGDATELLGTLKAALPKSGGALLERMELGSQYIVEFGALEGAKLTLKGKTTESTLR